MTKTQRVLVTGSSKGIGAAIARKLAADGWMVAVHYSTDEPGARRVCLELGEAGSGYYGADLADLEQAKSLFDRVEADGALSAVVNNAGVYLPIDILKASESEFEMNLERTFAINVLAPLYIARSAARQFGGRGCGKILNVASRVGFKGEAGASTYAASKAALINLTRSLAVELAPAGVQVFGIAPGWVDTAMARGGMDEKLESIISTLPLGRMASSDDCACAVVFLLSDGAAYLSGQVIDINGASYFH